MNKLHLILRLKMEGKSIRHIGRIVGSSRNSIDKYIDIFEAHPFDFNELYKLSEEDLFDIVKPKSISNKKLQILYESIKNTANELKKTGITKQYLWKAYKSKHTDGVGYSQYCEHFKKFIGSQQFSYIFDHKAGDKLMVDFAGKKLFLTDFDTGEVIPVEFFVGVLPCSGFTFAMACMSQKSQDFLHCLASNLEAIGGVPQAIVTDNLKPAVNKASKYDPEINGSLADFGQHYNTAILPTRAYKPKDKAMVEGAVKILYSRVYAPLYGKVFHTLSALNKAIFELVKEHNSTDFQKKTGCRNDMFLSLEKESLQPLPATSFELSLYQQAKVHPNCHVMLSEDKHHYSVPYAHMGQKVTMKYTQKIVEIYVNFKQVAIHERLKSKHQYTTNKLHLPPTHRYFKNWSSTFFQEEGQKIGSNTAILMGQILGQRHHPEQAFKLCFGVLQLAKKHGNSKLEEVAAICLQYDIITYNKLEYLFKIDLKNIEDRPEKQIKINHQNLRGAYYYQ